MTDLKPMRRFGPIGNPDLEQVPTPVGEPCAWCEELIEAEDSGVIMDHIGEKIIPKPHHRECFLRSIIGSVGHIRQECSCWGGDKEDPEGMTKREAAIAAVEEYNRREDAEHAELVEEYERLDAEFQELKLEAYIDVAVVYSTFLCDNFKECGNEIMEHPEVTRDADDWEEQIAQYVKDQGWLVADNLQTDDWVCLCPECKEKQDERT